MNRYEVINTIHEHNILPASRELFIMDRSYDDGEYISMKTAEQFIKNLFILESLNTKRITIHQMTHGGSWNAGLAIFDAMIHSPCEFTVVCHGVALSMGSIIPQACTYKEDSYRFTYPNCCWMVHEIAVEYGDIVNQKQQKALAGYTQDAMTRLYRILTHAAHKTGTMFKNLSEHEVMESIMKNMDRKQDWYFDAKAAQLHGFVDYVMGTEEAADKLKELASE